MFIFNCWYVAAWGSELSEKPIARRLLNEPVVLFRSETGLAVALEDRCCHRNYPLSFGTVVGETIVCGYHGMTFDCSGQCVKVPGQELLPTGAKVRCFPTHERDGFVWFWPGDPALANIADIPVYPYHLDASWAHKGTKYLIKCHYELLNDNLIDLSHVGYVHGKTIGGTPLAHSVAEMKTERLDDGVEVRRWMRDSVPPPTYLRAVGFKGQIDRWMEIKFIPGVIRIYIGANDAGVGLDEAGHMDKMGLRVFNGLTPETDESTHYFWSISHNFKTDDPSITNLLFDEVAHTFEEDRLVVEAQQERFKEFPDRPVFAVRTDAGGSHARRVTAKIVAEQKALG